MDENANKSKRSNALLVAMRQVKVKQRLAVTTLRAVTGTLAQTSAVSLAETLARLGRLHREWVRAGGLR